MANAGEIADRSDEATILRTNDIQDLGKITDPMVQAVIFTPLRLPAWFLTLEEAVRAGRFHVPLCVLPRASRGEIQDLLESNLLAKAGEPELRGLVKRDILRLVDLVGEISHASRFMLRMLTAEPNTHCGFHVDTVSPGANPWGLLRVYNGAGTEYVDPTNVTKTVDFYRYLGRRERLSRDLTIARSEGDLVSIKSLEREIERLDSELAFVCRRDDIKVAPAGSIVEFKHIDISRHWSNHPKSMAWIHCSPMMGETRLVVNVSPDEPSRLRRGRGTGATARLNGDQPTATT